ncbi:MAG: hypothetical protein IMY70_00255, partial [Bacteroidetes bacterium]|nr:hypothetical protein [Bacteroidota bacterium]
MKTKILLTILITFFIFYDISYSQTCAIEITSPANDTIICLGDSIWLRSDGSCDYFMNNGFENGLGVGWSTANCNPTFPDFGCEFPASEQEYEPGPGPEGYYLWVGVNSAQPRDIITDTFDISIGNCQIKFWMRYGRQETTGYGDCEDPNEDDEGLFLQYSIDDGMTWIDFPGTDKYPYGENTAYPPFITYEPGNGGYWTPITHQYGHTPERYDTNSVYWWHRYDCEIPVAAISTSTRFRFYQEHNSTARTDCWGLDEVMIFCSNTADTNVVWNHGPIGFNPDEPVYPVSDTSY